MTPEHRKLIKKWMGGTATVKEIDRCRELGRADLNKNREAMKSRHGKIHNTINPYTMLENGEKV